MLIGVHTVDGAQVIASDLAAHVGLAGARRTAQHGGVVGLEADRQLAGESGNRDDVVHGCISKR